VEGEDPVGKSKKVAITVGFVGAAFTLLAYEQTFMTTTHSILLGSAVSIIALGIKEFDLVT
jgi:drug/metabolite transporter (DMT)-like permease